MIKRFAERSRIALSRTVLGAIAILTLISNSAWVSNEWIEQLATVVALMMTFVGCLGRIWCYAHIAGRKNEELVTIGPYSFCRNPLYLFSFIGAVGLGVSTCTVAIPALIAIVFLGVYPFVIRAEECRLESMHGEKYRAYCHSVPSVIPSFRGYSPAKHITVDMKLFGRGIIDAAWFLIAYAITHLNLELHEAGLGLSFFTLI